MPRPKPRRPVLLRDHPLVAGKRLFICVPFFEGGGDRARDVVLEREILVYAGSNALWEWVDMPVGRVLRFNADATQTPDWRSGSGTNPASTDLTPWYNGPATPDFTMEILVAQNNVTTKGSGAKLGLSGGGTNVFSIATAGFSNARRVDVEYPNGSFNHVWDTDHEVGRWRMFHLVKSGTAVTTYRDGEKASTTGTGSASSWALGAASDPLHIAYGGAFGADNRQDFALLNCWASALSEGEVVQRALDPWAIFAEGGAGGGGGGGNPFAVGVGNPRSVTIFGRMAFGAAAVGPDCDLVERRDGGTNTQAVVGVRGVKVTPAGDEPAEELVIEADPATMPPIPHTHPQADVTGLVADLAAKVPNTRKLIAGAGITLSPSDGVLDEDVTVSAAAVGQYRSLVYEVSGGDFTFIKDENGEPVYALASLE